MGTTTTLSRYSQKDDSAPDPLEDTENIQITQVVSCIVRAEVKAEHQSRETREKLLRDHIEGTDKIPLGKKFGKLFKNQ